MSRKSFISEFRKTFFIGALAASFLAACGGGGGGSTTASGSISSGNVSAGSGSLTLSITDSPVDSALAVVVTFTGVILNPEDGDRIEISYATPKQIDLLALNGGVTEFLLEDEVLPAGRYSWIRLMVDESQSYFYDSANNPHPLSIPSGAQTGLKLNRGFNVEGNGDAAFTIDFDLRKSVTKTGAGDYKLRPTLRIVDNSTDGTLSGEVDISVINTECMDNSINNPSIYAGAVYVFEDENGSVDDYDGNGDPVASTMVNTSDYSYRVDFLEEGDYLIAYTCDAIDDDVENDDVNVDFVGDTIVTIEAGQTTDQDF